MQKKEIVQLKKVTLGDGIPKICVPVVGRTEAEILSQAGDALSAAPDLVEWRVDFYEDIFAEEKAAEVLTALSEVLGQVPILFTFRTDR